jgi:hypothetical protein
LGIIEDSATYKVALGFDKGNVGAVSSGGKKVIEQYQSIARKLFIDVENSTWTGTKDNIRALGDSVKNCVVAYAHHTASSCLITHSYLGSRNATLNIGPACLRRGRAFLMQARRTKLCQEVRSPTYGVSFCAAVSIYFI